MSTIQVWPSGDAYQNAVLSPRRNLKDPRLHNTQVETRFFLGSLRPHLRSGNFGAVYKLSNRVKSYALKVFYKANAERSLRYRLIDRHLAGLHPSPHLVSFRYEEEGIQVNQRWFPTLVMDWVPGQPLDLYLTERQGVINNGGLCRAWAHLVIGLQQRRVAHGDMQHGNILVLPNGIIRLVDYDGMYVPSIRRAGYRAAECGVAAYQHPLRENRPDYFDERLDDFASLVLLLTFACLNADLWHRFHRDDNCLLISKQDLHAPKQSALFTELLRSQDSAIRRLTGLLCSAVQGSLDAIPPFQQVIADPAIRPILDVSWRPGIARTVTVPVRSRPPIASPAPRPIVQTARPTAASPANRWKSPAKAPSIYSRISSWLLPVIALLALLGWMQVLFQRPSHAEREPSEMARAGLEKVAASRPQSGPQREGGTSKRVPGDPERDTP